MPNAFILSWSNFVRVPHEWQTRIFIARLSLFATTGHWDASIDISRPKRLFCRRFPVSARLFVKWRALISTKQIAMMIVAVRVTGIDLSQFASWAGICLILCSWNVENVAQEQLKVGILFNRHWYSWKIGQELIWAYTSWLTAWTVLHCVMSLKSLNELLLNFIRSQFSRLYIRVSFSLKACFNHVYRDWSGTSLV